MHTVSTPHAPSPLGHYAQAIVHNGLVYVSGQLALDARTGAPVQGTIEEQTTLALQNMAAILDAAGSGKDRVLRTTVYVADIALASRMNQAYAAFFGGHCPARATAPVKELPKGLLVEIEAVAAVR